MIKILQWNILDPKLAEGGYFVKTPKKDLNWENRQKRIKEILDDFNPDIACLEEVQYEKDLFKFFPEGYQYFYIEKGSKLTHGNFLCFNSNKFELLEQNSISFKNDDNTDMSQNFIHCKLFYKIEKKEINILMSHFKAKNNPEIQKQQSLQLINFIKNKKLKNIIICGDFNCIETTDSQKLILKQLPVKSFRPNIFTTYKFTKKIDLPAIKRKIDYIYYDYNFFSLKNGWSFDKEVEQFEFACPNKICPSDHLPLFAEFEFYKK